MKKFWKALGLAAIAAAVVPYRVRKDEEAQTLSVEALLWQASRGPGHGEDKEQLDVTLGFKSPLQAAREESDLFADDDPEAAVVGEVIDFAQAAGTRQAAAQNEETEDVPGGQAEDGADEPEQGEEPFDPEA